MSFNRELAPKPILYKKDICKLLHMPYKPHFKCYIKKKYSNLSWREKKVLKEYIYDKIPSRRYRNYYLSQWEFMHYLCRYFIEVNPVHIAKQTLHNQLNYTEEQIYFKLKEESPTLLTLN